MFTTCTACMQHYMETQHMCFKSYCLSVFPIDHMQLLCRIMPLLYDIIFHTYERQLHMDHL